MEELTKKEGLKAIETVLKVYPDLVKNVYSDGASSAIQEIGGLATDLIRGARLVTAPIQYMGHLQTRLSQYFKKVESEVPKERQISPSPTLLLPLLEKLKYQVESDLLTTLYVELLTRACDTDRVNEAHPAFINIIPQLSPDEAIFIYHLACNGKNAGKYFVTESKGSTNKLFNHLLIKEIEQPLSVKKGFTLRSSAVVSNLFPLETLSVTSYIELYVSHLKSLNLVMEKNSPGIISLHLTKNDSETGRLHRKSLSFYKLTEFGQLFSKACIPKDMDLKDLSTERP